MMDEKRQEQKSERYEQAINYMLEKKAELGRMPRERDLKKDSMVNVAQLVKDLGKKSFSEATIEVLRYVRAQEGRPENLLHDKQRERTEKKEVVTMVEEKAGRPKYTYADVWQFAKEHELATLSEQELAELHKRSGGPVINTVRKFLGRDKAGWVAQLACETAEEGLKAKEQFELEQREQEIVEPISPPKCLEEDIALCSEEKPLPEIKAVTQEELIGMIEAIGTMSQRCKYMEAKWEAVVYAGEIPVEVTLCVIKHQKIKLGT